MADKRQTYKYLGTAVVLIILGGVYAVEQFVKSDPFLTSLMSDAELALLIEEVDEFDWPSSVDVEVEVKECTIEIKVDNNIKCTGRDGQKLYSANRYRENTLVLNEFSSVSISDRERADGKVFIKLEYSPRLNSALSDAFDILIEYRDENGWDEKQLNPEESTALLQEAAEIAQQHLKQQQISSLMLRRTCTGAIGWGTGKFDYYPIISSHPMNGKLFRELKARVKQCQKTN